MRNNVPIKLNARVSVCAFWSAKQLRTFSRTGVRLLVAAWACLLFNCAHPSDPADTICRGFDWWQRESKAGRDPLHDQRQARAYLTDAFLTSLANLRPDLENGPYLDSHLDAKLKVASVRINGDSATARVSLSGRATGVVTFEVRLIRESGSWKIDDAKLVEN